MVSAKREHALESNRRASQLVAQVARRRAQQRTRRSCRASRRQAARTRALRTRLVVERRAARPRDPLRVDAAGLAGLVHARLDRVADALELLRHLDHVGLHHPLVVVQRRRDARGALPAVDSRAAAAACTSRSATPLRRLQDRDRRSASPFYMDGLEPSSGARARTSTASWCMATHFDSGKTRRPDRSVDDRQASERAVASCSHALGELLRTAGRWETSAETSSPTERAARQRARRRHRQVFQAF